MKYGPKIVTDGLVLCLDAADRNSYPGSGTIWRDLSGNGNHGTLTNGPTFDGGNGGSIVFDGSNDYVTTDYIPLFTGDFAINLWIKFNAYNSYQNAISSTNDGNAIQGFWLEFGTVRGFTLYNTGPSLALTDNVSNAQSLSTNIWYNVCVSRVGTGTNNLKLYIDNVLYGQNTYNNTIGHSSQNLLLAKYSKANFLSLFNGLMSVIQIYSNRGLSTQEIQQNYNTIKTRFGH